MRIDAVNLEWEGIAKSSVISLAMCLRAILESPGISGKFKGYILNVVGRGYIEVAEGGKHPRLAAVYKLAVLEGGQRTGRTVHTDED